ncbi:methionine--tRNA ligase [Prochlorococcus marinus]|uniref:methionine--tRNA ligase n=1 Tax=Prochlorococcus marinus TaxID=1219 RepID=UPI0022B4E56A|nr:methionine--tRNA ligase [Prochlorococcus marinus]
MHITITTPLYYVNDKPHLGSTYTTIACDAFARYHRLIGNKVEFITGVDEHGQKIQRTAESKNIKPIEHCDSISKEYQDLWSQWFISNDHFVRTTSHQHIDLVERFFKKVNDNGDIRIGNQKGWYCVGCEEYKEVKANNNSPECPIHLTMLEWRDEENLFFCLSKYQKEIEKLVSDSSFIQPSTRRNEIINFVSKGLKDFSISRINVKWGIPVPGYKGHTFYVWFDALLGYISALSDNQQNIILEKGKLKGWPNAIHVIGKDILRFHAVYWPAMLMSAGLDIPQKVFGHGFLTREGLKMGKSLGNVLDPKELLDKYGDEPLRWFLLSDIKFGQDGDFQQKRFIELVNNDLANTIGNLLNRTLNMSRKWFNNSIPTDIDYNNDNELKVLAKSIINDSLVYYENLSFKEVCQLLIKLSSASNLYLNDKQPWKLIKDNNRIGEVSQYIYNVLESCRIIALLINPILPKISQEILRQLGYKNILNEWKDELKWGRLKEGTKLPIPKPILNRIE